MRNESPEARERRLVRQREYAAKHKGSIAVYKKSWHETHAEEIAVKRKAWYQAHRDEQLIKQAKYRESHQEQVSATKKAWYQGHREHVIEKVRTYARIYRDEINAKAKEYRQSHVEAVKATKRCYYEEHKKEILAKAKGWRDSHRAQMAHYLHVWSQKHPQERTEIFRRSQIKRKRLLANRNCDLTAAQWRVIKQVQLHRCAACGQVKPLTQDHIVPLSKGGHHTASNIQGLCLSCNSRKHVHIIDYRGTGNLICQQLELPLS